MVNILSVHDVIMLQQTRRQRAQWLDWHSFWCHSPLQRCRKLCESMLHFSYAEALYLRASHFIHGTRMSANTLLTRCRSYRSQVTACFARRWGRRTARSDDVPQHTHTPSFPVLKLTIHPCSTRLQVDAATAASPLPPPSVPSPLRPMPSPSSSLSLRSSLSRR